MHDGDAVRINEDMMMNRAHRFPRQNLTTSAANLVNSVGHLVNSAAHRGKADEIPRLTADT